VDELSGMGVAKVSSKWYRYTIYVHVDPFDLHANHSNLLYAAGATLLWMTLNIHSGSALTPTIAATFHAKRAESTNDISVGIS
jgi:hypothetical protein